MKKKRKWVYHYILHNLLQFACLFQNNTFLDEKCFFFIHRKSGFLRVDKFDNPTRKRIILAVWWCFNYSYWQHGQPTTTVQISLFRTDASKIWLYWRKEFVLLQNNTWSHTPPNTNSCSLDLVFLTYHPYSLDLPLTD